ncbi:MAG: NAD(P)-dependent oxidoreductase [Candidatus Aureabacteria bacterium]|nr:NAD(P)-dependent oxidoreductase [Candidatus Auribacterota bacterium]
MSGLTSSIERPVKERLKDWKEIHKPVSHTIAYKEAIRCNFCFEAPCTAGCPAGVDVSAFIRRINVGDTRSALRIIKDANPFAGVCGRICPAEIFCIGECRNKYSTAPTDIAALQRYVADVELVRGYRIPEIKKSRGARKVACIGAGPASLACAVELARRGHDVSVFEQNRKPGGMLTYGIPSYRLSQDIVDAEIEQIKKMGVKILTGKKITNIKKLKAAGYAAAFVGAGAWKSKWQNIEGTRLKGVWDAMEFLTAAKFNRSKPRIGNTVAIFGAGNTAMDCAGTALRLGAKRVIIIYRRGRAEMPAWESEVALTFKEGTEFMLLTAPKRILGKNKVEAVECIKMKLGPKDESGRPRPIPIPGSEFTLKVDTVIQALGQETDRELFTQLGLRTDKHGCIKTKKNGLTSIPGVFAGGDAVNGGATAVEAVAAGKTAAEAIDRYLKRR